MSDVSAHCLGVYLHLAQASLRGRQLLMRDRMLVLSASIAAELGLHSLAAHCRDEVLRHNPKHLLGRWNTIAVALNDDEFRVFLKQMRRRFPTERAERMLDTLGLDMARERETYYTDAEYAAAIIGTTPIELDRRFPAAQN